MLLWQRFWSDDVTMQPEGRAQLGCGEEVLRLVVVVAKAAVLLH